jgi:hypothetical protein
LDGTDCCWALPSFCFRQKIWTRLENIGYSLAALSASSILQGVNSVAL